MNEIRSSFIEALDSQDKKRAVEICIDALDSGSIEVVDLYLEILGPALGNWECDYESDRMCIWNEHIRSSIVRTVMECCYPYIIGKRGGKRSAEKEVTVAVLCPPEEYHEIGARMISDIFTIAGYNSTFVGANTPLDTFLEAMKELNPSYIAISVSNYYNLINTRRMITKIREHGGKSRIVVGGKAFEKNPNYWKEVGADIFLKDPREIFSFGEGDKK
ncbi:cobalamin-binding protein [Mesotoga sp. HF07.pep.5.2.highcov]|uniref:Putative cobalamin binding protein n=1 Tax=Mesotoga prima MesG1.Ag.4.2 TaxID=660470 RepID=I2F6T1_9BACT|nr:MULTISPECIES: cobalamin-dependent protein [Mesotoga]MCP5457559.1 cobalamin B12-binding domain-containing protein [Thermotogota bacterium]CCU84471.1 Cobalamin B12-binding domain protein [Mesotoga infera]AFK07634.1 putative cobalamin binding protein [Mesotoga prima MesG1.Ag.4.2]MCP5461243.1 cobalamin B12-binding domain-containing protein [Thermotogota bacterium]RLL84684.1 cobalamin-binding protein [Mesotoga sp. H07pep.5.4]